MSTAVASQGVQLEKILLTHGHLDHAGAAAALARQYGVPVEGPHLDDQFLLAHLAEDCGNPGWKGEACSPNSWLSDNDTTTDGEVSLGVRHCHGHTPGHVASCSFIRRGRLPLSAMFCSAARSDARTCHAQSRAAAELDYRAALATGR